ncbi:hypothetical protein CEW92_17275 [Bacillaceae bacterium SAS-127]|nr:hypothetical protein CEW92_17275 [Bacillaceae bacterium SAS-127]
MEPSPPRNGEDSRTKTNSQNILIQGAVIMNSTIISILIAYLVICIIIGIWATKKTKSSSDFYVAGKSLGMFVMAIAAFSSVQSGVGMVGGTALTFKNGLGFIAGPLIAASIGFGLTWFLVGRRIWELGAKEEIYTMGDIVGSRYKSRAAQGWMGIAVILGVLGYLGTQVQALGVIMNLTFGLSVKEGAIIGLIILAVYAVGGGMIAGVYTDVVQGVMMIFVSIIVFFYALDAGGGLLNITKTLQEADPIMASPTGQFPLMTIICWFFMMSLGMAGQPQLVTKFLMLKDVKQLKWGAFTSGAAYLITIFLVLGIGLASAALYSQGKFPAIASPDDTLMTFILNYTHPVIAGLVISGLLAAIMSTGDSFVNLGAGAIIRDIPKAFNIEVKRELFWSRIAVVALLVASALFAFYMNTLVGLLGVFGFGTFAAAIFPSVVLGLIWEKATKQAAVTSIVIGIASNFILEIGSKYGFAIIPPTVVNGAFAFALSMITFIVVSFLTQSKQPALEPHIQQVIKGI